MSAWRRRADHRGIQLGALALLLAATAALVYRETRGTSFLFDDWSWILDRRDGSLATYLDPHNQHLSLIPVLIYKLLFATFGIGSYVPYRVVMIACNLLLCGLVYWYARERVGAWAALGIAAVLATLGPGWEDFLWPFQIGFVLSLCAGVGALLALERRTRRADIAASALTAASLASSGVGIPVALGIAVDVAVAIVRKRRPLTDLWIIAVPGALFVAWWIDYQRGGAGISGIGHAPSFIEKEAASVVASLFGRAGHTGLDGPGALTDWGTPLLIALAALLVLRVVRGGPVPPRVAALATMLVTFWIATAVSRAYFGDPYASRYIYVGAVFALLLGVELVPALAVPWRIALAVVAVIAIGSNIGELRTAGALLRGYGQATTADLGALEIARPLAPTGYAAHGLPGYPLVLVPARQFFAIAADLGDPAASVAAIRADDEPSKQVVDRELIAIHRASPAPALPPASPGAPLTVDRAGSATTVGGGCVTTPAGSVSVTLPTTGLAIHPGTSAVAVALRRFAGEFQPLGTVAPGTSAALRIAPDRATQPWHVLLTAAGRITACGI
jgi:hypothetical protein